MKNQNVKMRVNNNKDSECSLCNEQWKNVPEMYDMMLGDHRFTICMKCVQEIFTKFLKADCMYNSKLKSSEDMARQRRFEHKYGHSIHAIGYQIK